MKEEENSLMTEMTSLRGPVEMVKDVMIAQEETAQEPPNSDIIPSH